MKPEENAVPSFVYESKYYCAPMVGASELAFRMLVRSLGCHVCSTPMIDAKGYAISPSYREQFRFDPHDRPLIVQFSANGSNDLINATKYVLEHADAVEINLGCPEPSAKKHKYGAYLMNEEELVTGMITDFKLAYPQTPILCKIRVFDDLGKSIKFARSLQEAGCSMLTVHGRTKEERKSGEYLARWDYIKEIKESVDIPVISNGNIRNYEDVVNCLNYTKCDGVMSAIALLHNPALFVEKETSHTPLELAMAYLEFADKYQARKSEIKYHLECILRGWILKERKDLKDAINFGKDSVVNDGYVQSIRELLLETKAIMESDEDHRYNQLEKTAKISREKSYNSNNKKTICRYWEEGRCKYSDEDCPLLHYYPT